MNKRTLYKEAERNGVCHKFLKEIEEAGDDKRKLMALYVRGVRFVIKNGFPTNEYIKKNGGDIAAEYGVHIDEMLQKSNPQQIIALGDTTGVIDCDGFNVCQIFAAGDADLTLNLSGHSFTRIDVLGSASVTINATGDARAVCSDFMTGGTITTRIGDNAAVRRIDRGMTTYSKV